SAARAGPTSGPPKRIAKKIGGLAAAASALTGAIPKSALHNAHERTKVSPKNVHSGWSRMPSTIEARMTRISFQLSLDSNWNPRRIPRAAQRQELHQPIVVRAARRGSQQQKHQAKRCVTVGSKQQH